MGNVYLDSCLVIYLIQGPKTLGETIRQALRPNYAEPPSVFVSDLTRLECRVWPLQQGDDSLLRQFDEFFSSDDLTKVPITTEIFDLATELRSLHRTKTPDALHLAAAMLGGCQEFWTNDQRLYAAAGKRIGLKVFS